jgi:uncharacterized delta-60 repeat protein
MKKTAVWLLVIGICLVIVSWLLIIWSGGCSTPVREEITTTTTGSESTTTTTLPPVSLDTTFGDGGVATYEGSYPVSMAIDPSGRILVVGHTDYDSNLTIWRFKTDGSLDGSFGGGDGFVTDSRGMAKAITIDSEEKILVVGNNYGEKLIAVWRFNSDGSRDDNFGNSGMVTREGRVADSFTEGKAVMEDSSHKILVAGETLGGGASRDVYILRLETNGDLDTGFNHTGYGFYDGAQGTNSNDYVNSITLDPSGNILATGSSNTAEGVERMTVWRISSGGDLDKVAAFTDSDKSNGNNVFVDSSGKTTVTGSNYITITVPLIGPQTEAQRLAIWRYDQNLELESGFGLGGVINIEGSKGKDYTAGGAVDPSGRILITGKEEVFSLSGPLLSQSMAVWRYNSNGTIDNSFGSGGKVTCLLNGLDETSGGRFVAVDPQGRIVIVGYNRTAASAQALTIWRYR